MSDRTTQREPDPSEVELDEDELGDAFGGRIARIAAWYTRNHIKFDLNASPGSQARPDK